MQQNDEGRRAGRPSLLSEQAPGADDQSILNKLDHGNGKHQATRAPGRGGRIAAVFAAVLFGGAAVAWVLHSGDAQTDAALVAATVPSTKPVATTAPLAQSAPDEPEVSASAILDDPAAPALSAPTVPPLVLQDGKDELTALLDGPSVAPALTTQKSAALAQPEKTLAVTQLDQQAGAAPADAKAAAAPADQPDASQAEKKTPAPQPETNAAAPKEARQAVKKKAEPLKLARKEAPKDKLKSRDRSSDKALAAVKAKDQAKDKAKDKAKDTAKVKTKDQAKDKDKDKALAVAPKTKPAPKAQPKVDSDVALLAALLAHAKANPAPRINKTAAEYRRCGTLASVAEADKCRERLCDGDARTRAECKSVRVARAAG